MPSLSLQSKSWHGSDQPRSKTSHLPAFSSQLQHHDTSSGSSSSSSLTSVASSTKSTSGRGGGAVKDMKQTFEVNGNTGTLNFGIPVKTSSGRSDVQPNLTLNYGSGSGNGPFGVGWKLSQGSITRRTSRGLPRYDDTDVFLLDGVDELIPVSSASIDYPPQPTSLQFRVEYFLPRFVSGNRRIERWTSITNHREVHWQVVSSDNVTTIYGDSDEARIFEDSDEGSRRTFTWLPTKTYDSKGNSMEFVYKPEDISGLDQPEASHLLQCELFRQEKIRRRARYLKAIKYGNRTPNRDMNNWKQVIETEPHDWMFEVVFDYGEHDLITPTTVEETPWSIRQDAFSHYQSGFEVRHYRLCRRILMFHHMAENFHRHDLLVSSMEFSYFQNKAMSTLSSVVISGYLHNGDTYLKEDLAPCCFTYSENPEVQSLPIKQVQNLNIVSMPGATPPYKAEWIDLNGDGAPGLLVEDATKTLYYQRNQTENRGQVSFGDLQVLSRQPLQSHGRYFEDINRNGHLDMVCTTTTGAATGYYERINNDWQNFRSFNSMINLDENSHPERQDLDGNGLDDFIVIDEGNSKITWYPSLAEKGFGGNVSVPLESPHITMKAQDGINFSIFANMTGDGLADLVRVFGEKVSYWPNLGHGRFGSEVAMGNSPVLTNSQGILEPSRIKFSDVDGSGTSDMLYFPPSGGVKLYYNLAGNSWSDATIIHQFPKLHSLATVSLVDLHGTGTTCLAWTGPDETNISGQSMQYLDLTNGQKPHLLTKFTNGTGRTWQINYASSTFFSRQAELDGTPWSTILPYPVHVVESTKIEDVITGDVIVSRFCYRDGIYDGKEREFSGFAVVDQWDAEEYAANLATQFERPPIHKKIRYHSGCENYEHRFFTAAGVPTLSENVISPSLELGNALRSLRGKVLEEAIYSDDDSGLQHLPYTVTRRTYSTDVVHEKGDNLWPSIRVIEKENLTCNFERTIVNPRCSYTSVLESNSFGQPLKTLSIAFGSKGSTLVRSCDKKAQTQSVIDFVVSEYTKAITNVTGIYREPAQATTNKWRLANFAHPEVSCVESVVRLACDALSTWKEIDPAEADVGASRGKVLTQRKHVYYCSEDLTRYLDLGDLEAFSTTPKEYDLVSGKKVGWEKSLQHKVSDQFDMSDVPLGYVDLEGNELQWRPGNEQMYSKDKHNSLFAARRSFYLPTYTKNALGTTETLVYDNKHLYPIEIHNHLGQAKKIQYDYQHLQPLVITDLNGNRECHLYDAFNDELGLARMGKENENIGDSLEDGPIPITPQVLDQFMEDPTKLAPSILGKLTTRKIGDRTRFYRHAANANSQPCFEAVLTRSEHAHTGSAGNISVTITYFDGQGQPIQNSELAHSEIKSKLTWCINARLIRDNKGEIVREYKPILSEDHRFKSEIDAFQHATTYVLDPLGRRVATLYADHTWTKTIIMPWKTTKYDQGDTVLIEDASKDSDVGSYFGRLDPKLYRPSWIEMARASGSRCKILYKSQYREAPTVEHMDAMGRVVCSVSDEGSLNATTSIVYSSLGHQRAHVDANGRTVQTVDSDLLQSYKVVTSMDTGAEYFVSDCLGKPVFKWTLAGPLYQFNYDGLGRETHIWMTEEGRTLLVQKMVYGEQQADAYSRNLNGQLYEKYDQSGVTRQDAIDFKGNCISKSRKLVADYKSYIDWNKPVKWLSDEPLCSFTRYDAHDQVVSLLGPNEDVTETTYDVRSLPLNITYRSKPTLEPRSIVSSIEYNAEKQPVWIRRGNKSISRYTYSASTGKVNELITHGPNGDKIQHKIYIRDCFGREVKVTDRAQSSVFFRNQQIEPEATYVYDGLGRLVSATGREQVNVKAGTGRSFAQCRVPTESKSGALASGLELAEYIETYEYDLAGNILRMTHHPTTDKTIKGWERTYHYDETSFIEAQTTGNRLSRSHIGPDDEFYTYDQANSPGCITSMPGFPSLSWSFEGRLRSTSTQVQKKGTPETTYYIYDSEGLRVRKVTERSSAVNSKTTRQADTLYLYNSIMHKKFAGDGVTVTHDSKQTKMSFVNDSAVVERCPKGKTVFKELLRFQLDGSVELDDESRLISYEEYSPFGAITYAACESAITAPSIHRYASYERDNETGLYHTGQRYYAAWLGRWLSPDPIGIEDDLNRYAYVGNSPVVYHDPQGTDRTFKDTVADVKNSAKQIISNHPIATTALGMAFVGGLHYGFAKHGVSKVADMAKSTASRHIRQLGVPLMRANYNAVAIHKQFFYPNNQNVSDPAFARLAIGYAEGAVHKQIDKMANPFLWAPFGYGSAIKGLYTTFHEARPSLLMAEMLDRLQSEKELIDSLNEEYGPVFDYTNASTEKPEFNAAEMIKSMILGNLEIEGLAEKAIDDAGDAMGATNVLNDLKGLKNDYVGIRDNLLD